MRRRSRTTVEFLRELRRRPCKDCGGTFEPHQMDFDHRDPKAKSFQITSPRAMLMDRLRLVAEIAKCEIVCANCHAVRSYRQQAEEWAARRARGQLNQSARHIARRARSIARRDFLLELRRRPCADCGKVLPPYILQFDHRDPATKEFNVAGSWCRSQRRILEEALKCDIVCPNCHRDRTFGQRQHSAGVAQPGRATAFQAVGRGSESRLPLSSDEDIQQCLLEAASPYAA